MFSQSKQATAGWCDSCDYYVKREVAYAPPLTETQIARVAAILRNAREYPTRR